MSFPFPPNFSLYVYDQSFLPSKISHDAAGKFCKEEMMPILFIKEKIWWGEGNYIIRTKISGFSIIPDFFNLKLIFRRCAGFY